MHNENAQFSPRQILLRSVIMLAISSLCGWLTYWSGLSIDPATGLSNFNSVLAVSIFILIISATLFFWNFRLAIAFIGLSVLLGANVFSLQDMIQSANLEIILFLVGMMTLVGVLKDLGLFTWLIQLVINMKRIDGPRFVLILVVMSGLMASVVDEVTSIVFMLTLVFQVCDTLKLKPTPFVLIAVMATNIGSSGTMLGNPVGILIGTQAGLGFHHFLRWATPVMLVGLVTSLGLIMLYYRKDIQILSERLEARRKEHLGLGPLVRIPYRRGLFILIGSVTLIALHHTIEHALGVQPNTMLLVAPLAISGVLMIYRSKRAQHYIESEVEWWTLLFFMMLFAVAGALEHTGVTQNMATQFQSAFKGNPQLLTPVILFMTAIGSAFVDNIVFVAAFIPVIKALGEPQLWWALLFGACFGGNITAIGSTANIVALGMLDKRYRAQIAFLEWLKIGAIVGSITCVIAWIMISLMAKMAPQAVERLAADLERAAEASVRAAEASSSH